jgi:hypothetical protein
MIAPLWVRFSDPDGAPTLTEIGVLRGDPIDARSMRASCTAAKPLLPIGDKAGRGHLHVVDEDLTARSQPASRCE